MVSLFIFGSYLSAILSGISIFTFPSTLESIIKSMINLKENGAVWPIYKAPPVSTVSSYWVYDMKNPTAFLKGEKPNFRIRGPVMFDAFIRRKDIRFGEDLKTVRFSSYRDLILNEATSKDLDTQIYAINLIFASIDSQIKDNMAKIPFSRISEPLVYSGTNMILDQYGERLVYRTTPRELLLQRNVKLLESLMEVANRFGLGSLLPPTPTNVGFAAVQSFAVEDTEIHTGVKEPEKYAEVKRWRGRPTNENWRGSCSVIEGTNGELYKPYDNGEHRKVFFVQLCRTFNLDKLSDETNSKTEYGATLEEYGFSKKIYEGARKNFANRCYCEDTKTFDCQYNGLLNMKPCYFGAPLYFARANMAGVDRNIRSLIGDGVEDPSIPDIQSFYIEPTTGTVGKANLTLLAVLKITRQRYLRDTSKVGRLQYVPVFATNEFLLLPGYMLCGFTFLQFMRNHYVLIFTALTAGSLAPVFLMQRNKQKSVKDGGEKKAPISDQSNKKQEKVIEFTEPKKKHETNGALANRRNSRPYTDQMMIKENP